MALGLDFSIQAEKLFDTRVGGIDDLLRYAMVLDVEKANSSTGISQLRYHVGQRSFKGDDCYF
jgi:hypothetical protein